MKDEQVQSKVGINGYVTLDQTREEFGSLSLRDHAKNELLKTFL